MIGYTVGNRLKGFDMTESKIVLKNLAKFHALPISVRHYRPEIFEAKFKPFLCRVDIDAKLGIETRERMKNTLLKEISNLNEFNDSLAIIENSIIECERWQKDVRRIQDNNLFCTVVHNDLWVNNMMIKYDEKTPVHVKLIDFQLTMYGSLAHDIIFFMYTSVEESVLKNNFDDLLKYYFMQFINVLNQMNIFLNDFSYEKYEYL